MKSRISRHFCNENFEIKYKEEKTNQDLNKWKHLEVMKSKYLNESFYEIQVSRSKDHTYDHLFIKLIKEIEKKKKSK